MDDHIDADHDKDIQRWAGWYWTIATVSVCGLLFVADRRFEDEWHPDEIWQTSHLVFDLVGFGAVLVVYALILWLRDRWVEGPPASGHWLAASLSLYAIAFWVPPVVPTSVANFFLTGTIHIHFFGAIAAAFLARYLVPRVPSFLAGIAVVIAAVCVLGNGVEILEYLAVVTDLSDETLIEDTPGDLFINLLGGLLAACGLALSPNWRGKPTKPQGYRAPAHQDLLPSEATSPPDDGITLDVTAEEVSAEPFDE